MTLRDKAWSPYAAGILIGLLQVPAFLLIETALGTSSSYVTIGAYIASVADASIGTMDYLAKHMYGAKNLWQVGLVIGIAIGAFISMTLSGVRRQPTGTPSRSSSASALTNEESDHDRQYRHH
jgi:hypothetical protein